MELWFRINLGKKCRNYLVNCAIWGISEGTVCSVVLTSGILSLELQMKRSLIII
jgi:TRAP-type mannitol/chloroaromatic compound transport system permease large subunit